MSEIPEDILSAVEHFSVNYMMPDPAEVRLAVAELVLAERDQAKQTAKAALRFVEKALNDISDSEEDAIDSLERARIELIEVVEAA